MQKSFIVSESAAITPCTIFPSSSKLIGKAIVSFPIEERHLVLSAFFCLQNLNYNSSQKINIFAGNLKNIWNG